MAITHTKVSSKSDSDDSTLVRPSDWNADHTIAAGTVLPAITLSDTVTVTAGKTIDGRDVSVDGTKLDGVETLADVTDAINVNAAGAVMESDGISISNDGAKTTIAGTAGDYNRIGDAGTTSHGLASEDDLLITGMFEVNGNTHFNGSTVIDDNVALVLGRGFDSWLKYIITDADALMIQFVLPHVDENANNVPVLAIGDRNMGSVDIGAGGIDFSGITEPTLAMINAARDDYASLSATALKISQTQVVGARVIDARADDALNSGDATTDGVIDALRDAMITHGLIAAA